MPKDRPPFHGYQDAVLWPGREQDAIRSPRYGPQDSAPRRVGGRADGRPRRSKVSAKVTDVVVTVGLIVVALLLTSAMTWVMTTLPGLHGALR